MSHNPERDAAAFLGGGMRTRDAARFEEHLLVCDACWSEVSAARAGRSLVEGARELAPQSLREDVRAAVLGTPDDLRVRRRRPAAALLAAALVATVALAGAVTLVTTRRTSEPSAITAAEPAPIAAAVADFRTGRLPTMYAPTGTAPNLSSMGLVLTGAGAGAIADVPVDAFAYSGGGRRVLVYLSRDGWEFPVAVGARFDTGASRPWTASAGDVDLLCSTKPHEVLIVGDEASLVRHVAETMGAI